MAASDLISQEHYPQAFEDAEALRKACQGWGTDEKAIISILGHRNAEQRKQIRLAYQQLYQEDLKAVYRWILDPADRDAVLAHVAIKKSDVDSTVIIEISCIRSPDELLEVRKAYQNRYKHSLEEDVAAHTKGDLRKLLVGLVSSYRYDGEEIDNRKLGHSEAEILHEAIKEKAFNSDEVIRILTTRSKAQLNAIFNRYREEHATSITKNLLGDSPPNDFQKALHTTVRCLTDPHKYFAKILRDGVKKLGTDEDSVTRVIVTRAEKDLKVIKELYYKKNSVPLEEVVAKETSGDYKRFLLTLLGKEY
ncbi:hypothetical protein FEM48_Zijuj03G0006600 [Ziziphus jujuba var. spinosa]|uniref:Annexin n=1 Tax=Ziziphus jujuba var. spinosa TaxID=714518 RepID=A0A978VM71_ZIZJJ|nr:hypothetical protein FEM48_Zijuj03G0006600 [Ziziphus jujuba var. spinosa]